MKISDLQINTQSNDKVSYSPKNKEVRYNYLPEDKVSISIQGTEKNGAKVKTESTQKALSNLKLSDVDHLNNEVSIDDEGKNDNIVDNQIRHNALNQNLFVNDDKVNAEYIDIKQQNLSIKLGRSKKDGFWNSGEGGMFNAKGSQNGATQGRNIQNSNIHLGHINDQDDDQIGHNILNQGIYENCEIGDVFKDRIVGRNKRGDYWAKKK